ncbi:alpha/beta hydrolase [Bacillus sp. V5-8f]|uniref:alpha/beta hydrolase n=1 Tax=Bacillus sp. V5-8f TaxID=2053044 RepID=UPI000C782153|nr:alpha/beta hydrolase [Bacillus sp. V5-8f]PLT35104.1 lipase [Bacillus sp. V5-8f]
MTIHPKMQFFLDNLLPVYPEGYTPTLEDIRARNKNVPKGSVEAIHRVEDRTIKGPESEVPIRIYTPEGSGPFPMIVFFHGGGFVYGDLESHDSVCRSIVKASQHILVAVDYRLAPEHPFPAAPNDCYAATKWVYDHADELNGDKERLSVAGDSAGGNLATVVSIMSRDLGGPPIYKQVLLYPATDRYQPGNYASYEENGSGYFLTTEAMALFSKLYVQNNELPNQHYSSPINAPDLSGLPPAYVITAGLDPLRDEGELYAEKLREAGVDAVVRREEDQIHGFFNIFAIMDSKDDIKEVYESIGSFLNGAAVVR